MNLKNRMKKVVLTVTAFVVVNVVTAVVAPQAKATPCEPQNCLFNCGPCAEIGGLGWSRVRPVHTSPSPVCVSCDKECAGQLMYVNMGDYTCNWLITGDEDQITFVWRTLNPVIKTCQTKAPTGPSYGACSVTPPNGGGA